MARRYVAKRSTKRWLEGAPDYVLCCFDHPNFGDRYTVVFGGEMQVGDTYSTAYLPGLATAAHSGCSGSLEFRAHELAMYRSANSHRKTRWRDLPEYVRIAARNWAEADHEMRLTPEQAKAIRDEEQAATVAMAQPLQD